MKPFSDPDTSFGEYPTTAQALRNESRAPSRLAPRQDI
jgi:hypothetical protein